MEMPAADDIPDDTNALKAALVVAQSHAAHLGAELATARAQASDDPALIAHLKLLIAKLSRDRFGPRSERTARLLDQLELQLEELEASATEDELAAEAVAAKTTTNVAAFSRQRPARKLGEDVTETLERDPPAVEGNPAGPGEVHLPRLREDQPGAGRVPCHPRAAGPAPRCWQ